MDGTSGERDRTEPTVASADLLERARGGDSRALSALFKRHGNQLRRWASGRLPRWARRLHDTADVVQETLLHTFQRIDRFEDRGRGALQAYLRTAVMNRIRDEIRKVTRRPTDDLDDAIAGGIPSAGPSPYELAFDEQQERKYKAALAQLTEDERLLVVGRIEMGYNYDQLALIRQKGTPEAARQAVRRAIVRLAEKMAGV
jgi:RNA polymerase sigma factor (sigma-70 family)